MYAATPIPNPPRAQEIYAVLDAYEKQCRLVEENKESFKGPHEAAIRLVQEVTLL